MPEFVSIPPVSEAPPDWTTIDWEVHCPLCEYNLRGLNTPRCPECGYHFAWHEVLDPNRRDHPYLFEHHPERNVWSFWKTALGAMRPRRFWSSLRPTMTSRPGRLFAYWMAGFFFFSAAAAFLLSTRGLCNLAWGMMEGSKTSPFTRFAVWGWFGPATTIGPNSTNLPSSIWNFLMSLTRECERTEELLWMVILVLFMWPPLTLLSLKVFRWSMRRAKVNKVHVRRCVFYSFDMIPPALTVAVAFLLMAGRAFSDGKTAWHEPLLLLLPLVCIAFCAHRLYRAYLLYLRFDHALLTVLASQVMVGLAVSIVWLPWLATGSALRSTWPRSMIGLWPGV